MSSDSDALLSYPIPIAAGHEASTSSPGFGIMFPFRIFLLSNWTIPDRIPLYAYSSVRIMSRLLIAAIWRSTLTGQNHFLITVDPLVLDT